MGAAEDEDGGCLRVPWVPMRRGRVPAADGAADQGRSSGGRGRATRTSDGGTLDLSGGAADGADVVAVLVHLDGVGVLRGEKGARGGTRGGKARDRVADRRRAGGGF